MRVYPSGECGCPLLPFQLPAHVRVVLIGGTSHAGKSALGRQLAAGLGWEYLSTDKLARHPGRPWRDDGTAVPQHVVEHYATLPVEELLADVLRHYEQNVLPQVEALVRARVADRAGPGLVLEGSALWPEFAPRMLAEGAAALWLIAGEELLTRRLRAESRYAEKSAEERFLIDKFLQRTLAYNQRMADAVRGQGLLSVAVDEGEDLEGLARACLRAVASAHAGEV